MSGSDKKLKPKKGKTRRQSAINRKQTVVGSVRPNSFRIFVSTPLGKRTVNVTLDTTILQLKEMLGYTNRNVQLRAPDGKILQEKGSNGNSLTLADYNVQSVSNIKLINDQRGRGAVADLRALLSLKTTQEVFEILQKYEISSANDLLNLIKLEKNLNAKKILQLLGQGVTYEELSEILNKIENDAEEIHRLMTNDNPDIQVGDIQFFSEENGAIGSIYFPKGRIRLLHQDGPKVELFTNKKLERYIVTKDKKKRIDENAYEEYLILNEQRQKHQLTKQKVEKIAPEETFVEFVVEGTEIGYHPSRGTPKMLAIEGFEQRHLNILYNIGHDLLLKLNKIKDEINKIGDLQTIINEIDDLQPSDHFTPTKEDEKELQEFERKKREIEQLQAQEKKTINQFNNLLIKWVTNHSILNNIQLNHHNLV